MGNINNPQNKQVKYIVFQKVTSASEKNKDGEYETSVEVAIMK